ncbi:hypothetical protein ON010_g16025 [Phytophthora cinnamomi]|nr:hypothetical protein ON010_g16025 [Phytophthora cinnamomi]
MLLPQTPGDMRHMNEFLSEAKIRAHAHRALRRRCVGLAAGLVGGARVHGRRRPAFAAGSVHRVGPPSRFRPREDHHRAARLPRARVPALAGAVDHPPRLQVRNVLLSSDLAAKMTDFGISREQLDRTMTAGVGPSRWMARGGHARGDQRLQG